MSRTDSVSIRHTLCVILLGLALPIALAGADLTLQVSNETAPAGGWVQVKVSLAAPALVAKGRIAMDFDPSVFGDVGTVAVFSAAGDAYGFATATGQHLDVHFSSPSGSVGQLRNLPIVVATIPVLQSAKPGTVVTITTTPGFAEFYDPSGSAYTVTATPGALTVAGTLSVQSVAPGGGIVPAGGTLRIRGTGFTPQTRVTIDGVSISSTSLVGPQEIDVTVGGPAEMTGKRVTLLNPGASAVTYFASLGGVPISTSVPPAPSNAQPLFPNLQPVFPLETQLAGMVENSVLGLQNPSPSPIDATLGLWAGGGVESSSTLTVPPYSSVLCNVDGGTLVASAKDPLRMVGLISTSPQLPGLPPGILVAFLVAPPAPQQIVVQSLHSLTWSSPAGSTTALTTTLQVSGGSQPAIPFDYTVRAAASSGGSWLSVTPGQGSTSRGTVSFTVSANPPGLTTGTYSGTITIAPLEGTAQTVVVPVTITVLPPNTMPPNFVSSPSSGLTFQIAPGYGSPPSEQTISVTSRTPVDFSVAVNTSSNVSWLSATASSTTTPATVTVTVNLGGFSVGTYSGSVAISGTQNSVSVPVTAEKVSGKPQFNPIPSSLVFSAGGAAPNSRFVNVDASFLNVPFTATATTSSGGSWLSAKAFTLGLPLGFLASVNTAGLAAGTYNGTVTVSSDAAAAPAQVPVTLYVGSTLPSLSLTAASVTITTDAGSTSAPQTISAQSSGTQLPLYGGVNTDLCCGLFTSEESSSSATTSSFSITATPPLPGTYYGTFSVSGPDPSISASVPVTVFASVTPSEPPTIASVVSSATQIADSISPGEIISIHGLGVGPAAIRGFMLDDSGNVATSLGSVEILFDGKPAPLLYASPTQVNAIVPYEVSGKATTTIQVVNNGISSAAWAIPVSAAAPGIFTQDETGQGPAAVLNQDNSVNGPSNPALRGTVIQVFATGGGQTSPPAMTASITPMASPILAAGVAVSIGGVNAQVVYAGAAPEEVAGLVQVNAVVPDSVTPGAAVPVAITIGGMTSADGAMIAVQ